MTSPSPGSARQNEVLRCSAVVAGQGARLAYQWLRTEADGSGQREIAGATGAEYTVAAADVGKKVLCRVTATDGGGAAAGTSAVTAGPFADGALVGPPAPGSPPQQPGGSPGGTAVPATPLPGCASSAVTGFGTATRLTRTYAHSGFGVSGRLVGQPAGTPLGGATLEVVQTVRRSGVEQRKQLGTATTTPWTGRSGRRSRAARRGSCSSSCRAAARSGPW